MDDEIIIERLGGVAVVARLCECSAQAVTQWKGVHPVTGKPRHIPKSRLLFFRAIRPDLFIAPAPVSKSREYTKVPDHA